MYADARVGLVVDGDEGGETLARGLARTEVHNKGKGPTQQTLSGLKKDLRPHSGVRLL